MNGISFADWIAFAAVGLNAIAYLGRWRRTEAADGAARATTDATVKVEIAGFQKVMDGQTAAMRALEGRQQDHELKDERFQATMEQVMRDNAATNDRFAHAIENLNAQIARLVPGDVFAELPGSRSARRPER